MLHEVKSETERSYGHYCGLARALDLVGDRWTLLVVRELLIRPLRYNELKTALGGVATNLLAGRLRTLERSGVVERRLEDAGVVYALTPWGEGLREPIDALLRWSAPLMRTRRESDAFAPRWLALALPALLSGVTASPRVELGLRVEATDIVLAVDERGVQVIADPDHRPATVLSVAPEVVLGLAARELTVDQALAWGALEGDANIVRAVFPATRPHAGEAQGSRGPGRRSPSASIVE